MTLSQGAFVPTVTQIEPTDELRSRSTHRRVDYADAFEVTTGVDLTAAEWAKAMINDAPARMRLQLITGWMSLGLNVRPWQDDRVLGWAVRRADPAELLIGADSMLGLRGELLFLTHPGGVTFSTLIGLDTPAARFVWSRVIPTHQAVVASLLRHAAKRR